MFDKEYEFFPQTWIMPRDWHYLRLDMAKDREKMYIVKPTDMSQGKGIYLTKFMNDICPGETIIQ